jgi:hypothetical protein
VSRPVRPDHNEKTQGFVVEQSVPAFLYQGERFKSRSIKFSWRRCKTISQRQIAESAARGSRPKILLHLQINFILEEPSRADVAQIRVHRLCKSSIPATLVHENDEEIVRGTTTLLSAADLRVAGIEGRKYYL